MKQMKQMKDQKGFSLLEILLVLGIAASLVIGAFVIYPKVQASNRAQAEITNLMTIAAGVKNLYANRPGNYAGVSTAAVIDGGVAPSSMPINGTGATRTLGSAWSGTVSVAPAADPAGTANRYISITHVGVPRDECVKLATGVGVNFQRLTIGATIVKNAEAATPILDVDPAQATTLCAAGNITMLFDMK